MSTRQMANALVRNLLARQEASDRHDLTNANTENEWLRTALQRIANKDGVYDGRGRIVWDQTCYRMAAIAAAALEDLPPSVCAWTIDHDDDAWHSECGKKWYFSDDGLPRENNIFCFHCGRRVEIKKEIP